jgi:SPP1 gp7 family putative phage head morphogenesis protein
MSLKTTIRRRKEPENFKVLRPIHPNCGIEAEYRKRLDQLIEDMQSSVTYWLTAEYKASGLAQDDLPANRLQSAMSRLTRQWQDKFNEAAAKMGLWFASKTKSYSDLSMASRLKDIGLSVDFKMTQPMRDAYQAVIHEQVGLIRSIASEHLQEVQGLVMRSVQQGRNLGELSKDLTERYGITKRRAALISRDQSNKATSTLTRVRQQELGIAQAKWKHSHAGKHPRPSHVAVDGEVYDVEKGMFIDGEWIFPGQEINCRCTSQPIIKGFKA